MRLLVAQGCKLVPDDIAGMSPFHLAIFHGHDDVVDFFLSMRELVDVNEPDRLGRSPFFLAAQVHHRGCHMKKYVESS